MLGSYAMHIPSVFHVLTQTNNKQTGKIQVIQVKSNLPLNGQQIICSNAQKHLSLNHYFEWPLNNSWMQNICLKLITVDV